MPNVLSFSQLVANDSLAEFQFNMPYIMTSDRTYESDFMNSTYQSGDTVSIRKVNKYITQRGRIATPEDTIEETVPLVIGPEYMVPLNFNSKELTLEITKSAALYQKRYASPAIQVLAASLERDISNSALLDLNYFSGSPTAPISDFAQVDLIYAQMMELGMPTANQNSLVLSPRDGSALKASNQNAFNPTLNQDISFKSQLGRYSVYEVFQSPATIIHQAGSFPGTPLVNGAVPSGATTITMDGFTASQVGVLLAGDTITFGTQGTNSAIQSVNAVDRGATGQLMPFTVQADVNSDAGGNAVVTISPAVVSDPANPRRNVNQPIPDNSVVNHLGTGLTYRIGIAYTSRALSLVMPPLVRVSAPQCGVAVDKETGISLRLTQFFDGINGIELMRMEFIAGFKWHQEYAIKVISAM